MLPLIWRNPTVFCLPLHFIRSADSVLSAGVGRALSANRLDSVKPLQSVKFLHSN